MILLVCGYDRSGKDAVAETIADTLDGQVANTSTWIIEHAREWCGWTDYDDAWIKIHQRDTLRNIGDSVTAVHPEFLFDTALNQLAPDCGLGIVTGIRHKAELDAVRDGCDGVIWVQRNHPDVQRGNCDLDVGCADHVITNDGTLEELQGKAHAMARQLSYVG